MMLESRQSPVASRQQETIAVQLQEARMMLAPIAGDVAALEARVLASHAWGMSTEALVLEADAVRDAAALQQLVARRLNHEPVSHIVGMRAFWRDTFLVTPDVLTPRADSETMIEVLLQHRPQQSAALRVLDLGTGSGCLLLSALREYRQATGVGVDQSEAALAVARRNAQSLKLDGRSLFVRSNWCSHVDGQFDVVLANPPYIPTEDVAGLATDVRDYEPHTALDGGVDGLDCYRSLLNASSWSADQDCAPRCGLMAGAPGAQSVLSHLNPNALVLFEVGAGQADDVAAIGQAAGLQLLGITSDLAGIPRVVAFSN